jgi:hypothetical protein
MMDARRVLSTLVLATLLGSGATGPREAGAAEPPRPDAGAAPAARPQGPEAWRAARWGMTPDDVLAAFPGESFRLSPAVKLADGNVVAVGIDGHVLEGLAFNVRFVFQDGKLVLVSLRTPQARYADADAFEGLRKTLLERWGQPLEATFDNNFVDLRQTRWSRGDSRADLKYIPGVVALVLYPTPVQGGVPTPGTDASPPAPASGSSSGPGSERAPPPAPEPARRNP